MQLLALSGIQDFRAHPKNRDRVLKFINRLLSLGSSSLLREEPAPQTTGPRAQSALEELVELPPVLPESFFLDSELELELELSDFDSLLLDASDSFLAPLL